uniref:AlNc14C158G7699 protein n=1 Tax=Albugo laibachii Nc14 TaxID=890382 RepID=F0WMK9_9STRA|nr:AlNc14C158G7699 [Albugo laibachii Nc14]|eukprot:CCA22541.1 AlNc14C158G7699 [Albugo laibachii Nc14]
MNRITIQFSNNYSKPAPKTLMLYQIVYRQNKYEILLPEAEAFDYNHLRTHIVDICLELTQRWRIMYLDDENEPITISNNEELEEACYVLMQNSPQTIKLYIVPQPSLGDRFHGLSSSLAKLLLIAKNGTIASANRYAHIGRDTLHTSTKHTKNLVQRSKTEIALRMSRLGLYLKKSSSRSSYKKVSSGITAPHSEIHSIDKSRTLSQQTFGISMEPEGEPAESVEIERQDEQPEPASDVDTDCDSENEVEPIRTSWNQSILSLTYA